MPVLPVKAHPWYNFDRLFSYNGTFNFVCGPRGNGKTFGAKERAIKKFIKNGEQFIYLRRYQTELVARHTFFDDLLAKNKFPGWDFRIFGRMAQIAPQSTRDDKKRVWQTMGYFIALSNSQTQKSVSFPTVTTIIFDEFIIEKGVLRYLPDEATVFANFYSTVDRYQTRTKVVFLSNSVSIMNPYFIEYKIRPDDTQNGFIRKNVDPVTNDPFVVVHFIDSENFKSSVYDTPFGRFIQGTDYAQYAVESEFSDNHDGLVDFKPSSAKYQYTLETSEGMFSVWADFKSGMFYVQEKLPKEQNIYTLDSTKMTDDKLLVTYNDKLMQIIRTAFRGAKVVFDQPSTRNTFADVFKR